MVLEDQEGLVGVEHQEEERQEGEEAGQPLLYSGPSLGFQPLKVQIKPHARRQVKVTFDPVHPNDVEAELVPSLLGVGHPRDLFLVDIQAVRLECRCRVEFLVACVALEMFRPLHNQSHQTGTPCATRPDAALALSRHRKFAQVHSTS